MDDNGFWASYAMGLLEDVEVGDDIVRYLERIDATLAPFGGRFLVHGSRADSVEGQPVGDVVIIGFPTPDGAAEWYHSAAYQAIVGLRTRHSRSRVVILAGCDASHRGDDVVRQLLPGR